MEFDEKLYQAMDRDGIHIDGTINWASRDFQRFRVKNHWNNKKHLFVVLFGYGASYGDWRNPSTWKTIYEKTWDETSKEEREERKRHQEKLNFEKQALRSHAIWRAALMLKHQTWRGDTCHTDTENHPYVKMKRIRAYYGYQIRSYLILPITDINRNLQSLQYIRSDGFKRFKKHASPKGGMLFLAQKINKNDIIRVCEGYATGCSIYEAVGSPVVVSFGASNILSVSLSLRMKYPLNQIIICADNDQFNKQNTGLTYGLEAAQKAGAKIIYPKFDSFDLSSKPTDYNDLMCLAGIEEVEKQLLNF